MEKDHKQGDEREGIRINKGLQVKRMYVSVGQMEKDKDKEDKGLEGLMRAQPLNPFEKRGFSAVEQFHERSFPRAERAETLMNDCPTCGIGFFLHSGDSARCDHCDSMRPTGVLV